MSLRIDAKIQALVQSILRSGSDNIRNFCIMAHVDHGKSTLADNLLSYGGLISEKANCVLDFRDDEEQRGITINSASVSFTYCRQKRAPETGTTDFLINLIDSPGHADFNSEVSKGLRGVDSALLVVDAAEGIKPQTITVAKQAVSEGLTVGLFINKLDKLVHKVGGDDVQLKQKLKQVINKVNELFHKLTGQTTYFCYKRNISIGSAKYKWGFSFESQAKTGLGLNHVLLCLKNSDDISLVKTMPLHEGILRMVTTAFPNPETGQRSKIKSMWASHIRAESDQTGQTLLAKYSYVRDCCTDAPLSAVVTFINNDKDLGLLVTIRVISGIFRKGSVVYIGGEQQKVNRIGLVMGKSMMEVSEVPAGGLALIQGIKSIKLGSTISQNLDFPPFDNITYTQEPVVTVSIRPIDHENDSALERILSNLVNQNGTLEYDFDEQHNEYVLSGVGDLQLQVEMDRIVANHGIKLKIGDLKLRYKEVLLSDGVTVVERSKLGHTDLTVNVIALNFNTSRALAELTGSVYYKLKNSGEALQDMGFSKEYIKSIVSINGGCIVRDLVRGRPYVGEIREHLAAGAKSAFSRGTLIGAPVSCMQVQLLDAALHRDKVYRGPGEICTTFRNAINRSTASSKKTILEPYNRYAVTVKYDDSFLSLAEAELMRRRAKCGESEYFEDVVQLKGIIPLRELKGLKDALLSQSQGSTQLQMSLHGYQPCNVAVRQKITFEMKGVNENEY